ncbi:hypothetical protein AAG906_015465 [Vitis piasezkii]
MENEQSDTLEAILLVIRRFASVTKFMDPMDYSSLRTFASRIPYDAVVPGSSIPERFTDQSVGKGKFGRSAYFSMNESVGFSIDNTASMHFSKVEHIWFHFLNPFISQHEESEGSYYRWRLRYTSPARVVTKHGGLATPKILPRAENWMEAKVEANGSGIQEVPTSITLLTQFQVSALAGCKAGNPCQGIWFYFCAHHQQKDFHCLLYLSRNGFITVPGSLKRLIAEQHCKSLQSLPEPPSTTPWKLFYGNSACCINTEIQSSNTIPEWFIHQGVGCSVTVELPPPWYNTKLMGLAV